MDISIWNLGFHMPAEYFVPPTVQKQFGLIENLNLLQGVSEHMSALWWHDNLFRSCCCH